MRRPPDFTPIFDDLDGAESSLDRMSDGVTAYQEWRAVKRTIAAARLTLCSLRTRCFFGDTRGSKSERPRLEKNRRSPCNKR